MKKLWEEMNTIDITSQCTCVCTCGGITKMCKAEQDMRLIHFLMGLNEMYTMRGNIPMMTIFPSMAQAFAILSQEVRQREVRPHNQVALESTSLSASASPHTNRDFKTNYSSYRGGPDNNGNSNNNYCRGSSSTGNSYTQNKLFCDYCNRSGHSKDICYKLYVYTSNSRFLKGKGSASTTNAYTSEEGNSQGGEENLKLRKQMPLNLSKRLYEQLLNLLGPCRRETKTMTIQACLVEL
ncbi:hypothetical protein KY290_010387 [Solanum tuberosum]|uniref:Gag-pol polyprotein n=1 Tax=Solanum tuberosum TaxID=4113 RepID=A0ABQ7VZP9_SOLTU|nr:hypothetical protein KY290_010387 [Solanum tuberosum]